MLVCESRTFMEGAAMDRSLHFCHSFANDRLLAPRALPSEPRQTAVPKLRSAEKCRARKMRNPSSSSNDML